MRGSVSSSGIKDREPDKQPDEDRLRPPPWNYIIIESTPNFSASEMKQPGAGNDKRRTSRAMGGASEARVDSQRSTVLDGTTISERAGTG